MTKTAFKLLPVAALLLCGASQVSAQERSTADEALALISAAQAYVKANGLEKSIAEFNKLDGPFNSKSDINKKGDLYLFSVDPKGFQAIHGKNPKIVGKVTLDMKDSDGVMLIQELVKTCFSSKEGKGWTAYKWPNPLTKVIEPKQAYVERVPNVPDFCLGTGIYK
ncbi:cache domain-containing protein [Roseateles oligotrophus]|uniref:Cache domain-containing protein n=1 Tax=Roseateles oligotrophus TaxID=1769250 RepID=A0ABT2YD71_9BURK|nr:cache domain-containing protein [Roseateles oligotrophus]MCV2367966.1 cache domain-containing protein [Roseateles oligotrophus]